MSTTTDLPIIFLAFANEQHDGRYLENVVKEAKELTTILGPLSSNMNTEGSEDALCELVIKTNISFSEVADVLQTPRYRKNMVIFHYAGHADGYQLLLEGKDGESELVKGEGLVPMLSRLKNLKMVFLNGCSTQQLAQDLVSRGILTVIGTVASIADDTALLLSTRFYKGLANGLTLAGAWEDAKDAAKAVKDLSKHHRGIKLNKGEAGRFPWDVAFKDDAAREVFDRWNLPDEANYPLFNLPEPKKTQLPPSPFLFLKPYTAQHAEIFFGRSYYIRDLYLKILEPNSPSIILLYGESGAGKSSLLDAGLRPRLEAATSDADPGSKLFEVHYERRDHDLGLVGTLAKMLSYYSVEEAEVEEPAETVDDNANLEKLEKIESLAKSLEEETADTLLSFIDRYKAIRTSRSLRGRRDIYESGLLDASSAAQLREAWKQIEQRTGRRLILILDQVEEQYTRPNPEIRQELENLLQVLKEIFSVPHDDETDRIKGKIILGYREEFNAKIEARFKDYELSRSTVFLEQLNEADIKDIFRGLQSGAAGKYYNISVEDQLPDRMAGDLLMGSTAVAPVLQLLLTKLWKKTHDEKHNTAEFTLEAYNEIQSQGEEMEEYFETQMQQVKQWNPEVVESGLALDILHFHVSDLGTSSQRHIEAIRQRYKHLEKEHDYPQGFIVDLVNKLKSPEIFLLNDLSRGYTSLPHDTLAPIIMREYNRSDKLGQRSARILDTKAPDLRNAEDEQALRQLRLDYHDLNVVLGGQKGMRDLSGRERQLLQISMEEREKRERLRRIMIKGGVAAGLFILVLSLLAGSLSVSMTEQVRQGAINQAHEASLVEAKKDPTQAIELAQFAYNESTSRPVEMVHHLYRLFDENAHIDADGNLDLEAVTALEDSLFYLDLKPASPINSLDYHPERGALASLEDFSIVFWPKDRYEETSAISLRDYFMDPKQLEVSFTPEGQIIQVISRENRQPLYAKNGELTYTLWMNIFRPPGSASSLEMEMAEIDNTDVDDPINRYLGYYDFYTGRFVSSYGVSMDQEEFLDNYASILDPDDYLDDEFLEVDNGTEGPNNWVNVDSLFSIKLLNESRGVLNKKAYNRLLDQPWWTPEVAGEYTTHLDRDTVIALRRTALVEASINAALIWPADQFADEPSNVFYYEDPLIHLSALDSTRFLTAGYQSGLLIQSGDGTILTTLLPPSAGLIDLEVSRGESTHILAMTKDKVFIWDLSGQPIVQYDQKDIRHFDCSPDGKRFLTTSPTQVRAWMEGQQQVTTYTPPKEDQSIVLARLHEDGTHLVIGLSDPPRKAGGKGLLAGLRSSNNTEVEINTQVVLWNMVTQRATRTFKIPTGPLLDATISGDGRFAVAVQPNKAAIVSESGGETGSERLVHRSIENITSARGQRSYIYLSPRGTYIVRHLPSERRIELFDRQGRPVNSYSFKDGFAAGFNGKMFTDDDYFLIGNKSDELLYWHPEHYENGRIIQWASQFNMDIEDKQEHQLDTFMDYLPGRDATNKWWGLSLILSSFIFILLYFSDYIIRFVQQKKYMELGLYVGSFLVLSFAVLVLWGAGSEEASLRQIALYTIIWGTLAVLLVGLYRTAKQGRYGVTALLAALTLFMLYGSAKFAANEHQLATTRIQRDIDNWEKALLRDYQQYPEDYHNEYAFYHELETLPQELTTEQLHVLGENTEIFRDPPTPNSEGWSIVFGLILLALFLSLVGYPVFRAIGRYRADNRPGFYKALYLPVGFLSVAFWIAIISLSDYDYGDPVAEPLELLSCVLVLIFAIRQSRRYLRARQFATFGVFALPTVLLLIMLMSVSGTYTLAIATAFLMGRYYRQRQQVGLSFATFSAGMVLAFGALFWMLMAESLVILAGLLLLTPVLIFMYHALRVQLDRAAVRKAEGRPRWINYLAILGLWILGSIATLYFADELYLDVDYDYYEDDYADYDDEFYDDFPEEDQLGYDEESDAVLTGAEADAEDDAYLDEEDSLEEEGPLDEFAEEDPDVDLPTEESDPESEFEPETEFEPASAVEELIMELFADDENTRNEARRQLAASYRDDPVMIASLIEYNYELPDVHEGIWNTLYLLERQSDAVLQSQRDVVTPYLEWTAGRGYGPSTMERIQGLQARLE